MKSSPNIATLLLLVNASCTAPGGGGESFTTENKKLAPTELATGDGFGASVALSGDTAIIGAPKRDEAGTDSGAAYVFYRNQGGLDNWGLIKKITAFDGAAQDYFGAVAVYGDIAAVGSMWDDDLGSASGSVYIYYRNQDGPENWGFVKKIVSPDGTGGDWFGTSVSIYNDELIVGAPFHNLKGAAYIYSRNTGGADSWGFVKKLDPIPGNNNGFFAASVKIKVDSIVVGSPGDSDNGSLSGAMYIYYRDQGGVNNWGFVKKLYGSSEREHEQFGDSVDISGFVTVAGTYSNSATGAAYFFGKDKDGTDNWGLVKEYTDSNGYIFDGFGMEVAIAGNYAVISDPLEMRNEYCIDGAAFVYQKDQGGIDNWGFSTPLKSSDGEHSDGFGVTVAIDTTTVLIGATGVDDNGIDSGAVYIYYLE